MKINEHHRFLGPKRGLRLKRQGLACASGHDGPRQHPRELELCAGELREPKGLQALPGASHVRNGSRNSLKHI